jgi:hypothetical protein
LLQKRHRGILARCQVAAIKRKKKRGKTTLVGDNEHNDNMYFNREDMQFKKDWPDRPWDLVSE